MDKILLEGIQLGIKVGTTEEERSKPQPCRLDLTLVTNLDQAGQTGELEGTVDYAAVFRSVERICLDQTFTLLEEVAHQVCCQILENFEVRQVKLRIRKLQPFSDQLHSVGIEVKRKRRKVKK